MNEHITNHFKMTIKTINSKSTIKKVITFLVFSSALIAPNMKAFADVSVNGYYRSNGTYVDPHYRSDPNHTASDNWSSYGNTNPYTGQKGYNRNW